MSTHTRHILHRRLAGLTAPIFMETLLVMLLGVADTIMLGLYADRAVAAVGVVNQLLFLVFLIFGVTTAGTTVVCSQFLGARNREAFLQTVGVSLALNSLLGVLVSALLYRQGHILLKLMDLQPELMVDANAYIILVGGGAFLQAIALTFSAVLRSANRAVWPMWSALAMNLFNIAGNYALIFGNFGFPELGVTGAAISTVTSRFLCALLLCFITFRSVVPSLRLRLFRPFPTDKLRALLHIGLPSAGEQVSYCLSQVIITYFINMLGTDALIARSYSINLVMPSYLFSLALGQGGAICIGHLVGGGHRQAAFVLGRFCLRITLSVTIVMSILTALVGWQIIPFLSANPNVISMVSIVLIIDVFLEIGRSVNILFVNALRAIGDALYPFWVGVVVMWSMATGMGYVLGIPLGYGLPGMWVAFTLDECIRAVIFTLRWQKTPGRTAPWTPGGGTHTPPATQ